MSLKLNEWEQMVRDFHSKFGAEIGDQNLPRFKNAQLRKNLLTEEVEEFIHAVDRGKFDEAVHEAIDVLYVTIGALVSWGITDITDYFTEIHNANMKKVGGKTREDGKVMKPKDWKPANVGILVRTQPTRLSKKENKNEEDFPRVNTPPNFTTPIVPNELMQPKEDNIDLTIHVDGEKIIEAIKPTGGKRGRPSRNN